MKIKRNLHVIDRVARTIVGIGCVYAGFVDAAIIGNEIVSILVGIFGLINLVAAITSFCVVYALAGISTCSNSD